MEQTLQKLYNYETLSREKAGGLLLEITSGFCNEAQISGFLSVFLMRKLTLQELMGFQDAMLAHCNKISFPDHEVLDIVGTGGDGKNTFNISTTAAFVIAGAGIKVAKHGNYAASSVCGSSDVLQYLGYRFTADEQVLNHQLAAANICFLHAPLFHPVMKHVAAARKNLGLRSFFNLLGPIVNPASPSAQFLGVSDLSYLRMYQYLLQERKVTKYCIVTSLDGYDEISLTGSFKIVTALREQIMQPENLGMTTIHQKDIDGGKSVQEAAEIMLKVLQGKGTTAQHEVVIANSGFAIHCTNPERNINDCIAQARASLFSGKAYRSFLTLINKKP